MKLAVVGSPIAHSQSPAIHAAAYRALGLDWQYTRAEHTDESLRAFVAGAGAQWRGLSVTAPLKPTALQLAASCDEVARITGAANTLLLDGLRAWNTDPAGITRAFARADVTNVGHGLVVGGGATAVSAVVAFAQLGAQRLTIAVRDPARAERVLGVAEQLGVQAVMTGLDGAAGVDVAVSTLPASASVTPALGGATCVLDADYASGASRYEGVAQVVSGLDMLVEQALVQVRCFVHGDASAVLAGEPDVLRSMYRAAASISET